MMLGLANGDVPTNLAGYTPERVAAWADRGIRCLAVNFRQSHADVRSGARAVRELLADHGIHVAQFAGVNANLVHHDEAVRRAGRASVAEAIDAAVAIGATMISSGCGTNDDDYLTSFYAPHPLNYTAQSQERLATELRAISPLVEAAGLLYTIECHQLSTMRSPEVIREVMDAVDSPSVVANFDPVNLLDSAVAVLDNGPRMLHMVDTVGHRYGPSCHVKDVRITTDFVCHIDEAPPGEGVLDYDAYFEAASKLPGPTALIVEHLDATRSAEGIRYVRNRAVAAGVELL